MLLRHFAEDLGFKYISATNKDEYLNNLDTFINPKQNEKSVVYEVFTNGEDESAAIKAMNTIIVDTKVSTKHTVKKILGENNYNKLKSVLKR